MERTNDSMSAESMISDSSLPDRFELKDITSTARPIKRKPKG